MADDLIDRLRWHAETNNGDAHATCAEAAEQVERLRSVLMKAYQFISPDSDPMPIHADNGPANGAGNNERSSVASEA